MRTWALWDRKRSVLIGLLGLGALVLASACYVSNAYVESLRCELKPATLEFGLIAGIASYSHGPNRPRS